MATIQAQTTAPAVAQVTRLPAEEVSGQAVAQATYLGHHLAVLAQREAEWIAECSDPGELIASEVVRGLDRGPGPSDRVGLLRGPNPFQQLDDLGKAEGDLPPGAAIDDRRGDVFELESQNEVARRQVDFGHSPGTVVAEMDPDLLRSAHGLKRRLMASGQKPCRDHFDIESGCEGL